MVSNRSRIVTAPDYDFNSNHKKALILNIDKIELFTVIDYLKSQPIAWDIYICDIDTADKAWVNRLLPNMHKVLINQNLNKKLRKRIQTHPYFIKYDSSTQLTKELTL